MQSPSKLTMSVNPTGFVLTSASNTTMLHKATDLFACSVRSEGGVSGLGLCVACCWAGFGVVACPGPKRPHGSAQKKIEIEKVRFEMESNYFIHLQSGL
jgi:hypothetical protein